MSKYETIGKQWASSGAGAKKAAEEKKIPSIIEKEAKLKEDRDDARIKRDKDKLLQDKVMTMKLNAQLISEKNTRERLARQQEKEWAEALKKKNEDEMAMEKMNDTKRGKETSTTSAGAAASAWRRVAGRSRRCSCCAHIQLLGALMQQKSKAKKKRGVLGLTWTS